MKKIYFLMCLLLAGCVHPHFRDIKGENMDFVRQKKGEPDSRMREKGHEMWVYRDGGCTETVFFDLDNEAVDFYEIGDCSVKK